MHGSMLPVLLDRWGPQVSDRTLRPVWDASTAMHYLSANAARIHLHAGRHAKADQPESQSRHS